MQPFVLLMQSSATFASDEGGNAASTQSGRTQELQEDLKTKQNLVPARTDLTDGEMLLAVLEV